MAEAPVPARPNIHSNAFPWLKVPGSRRSAHPDMSGEGPVFSSRGAYCDIIKDRFANPDFGPCEVAVEAGISLRYLQKLFTALDSTCSHFIHSVRLDHAARLLERRSFMKTSQPISEIAYASGYGDYTNFIRKFRRRFGHTPGSHSGDHTEPGRIRTAESASLAHDV